MWVSYQKSRYALLEIIDNLRRSFGKPSEYVLSEFTVAFASALILVNGARLLRELFGNDELVRRKLNESLSNYGIPAGSFDSIQLSLTDPANALRIREATQFYDKYSARIRDEAQALPALQRLIQAIDQRMEAVRVSTRRYIQARVDERRHQLNDAVMQQGLIRALYAFQQWGSRAVSSLSTMPGYVSKLPESIAQQLLELIRPGDVFVTRKDCAVTNYFLPGYWPHAALYAGNHRVIESLKDGVRERGLDSPFGNDSIALIRPKLDDDLICESLERARTHVGKPYDFDFDFTRSDRLVCTEVVYRSYQGIGGIEFPLTKRAGRLTLAAEDLLALSLQDKHFQPVAVYCRCCSEQLLLQNAASQALRQTMGD
jgi:hypothetical protein